MCLDHFSPLITPILPTMNVIINPAVGVIYGQNVNTQNQPNPYYNQTPSHRFTGNSGLSPNAGYDYSQIPQQGAYPLQNGYGYEEWTLLVKNQHSNSFFALYSFIFILLALACIVRVRPFLFWVLLVSKRLNVL
jgi:hypothetical protein